MIAIDLGSNTLRVVKFDCETLKPVSSFEKVVKIADGLAQYGMINDASVQRVISAIKEAQEKIDFNSTLLKAVTTETLRRAVNAKTVLDKIKKETGVVFDTISGDTEAILTLKAVKNRLNKLQYSAKNFVLVDIGGGSTEVTFYYDGKVISKSFPLGIITISQTYKTLEKIEEELPREMLSLKMFCSEMDATEGKITSFVSTAGTPTALASMKVGLVYANYNPLKINGTTLTTKDLDFLLDKLISSSFKQREIYVGTGRADLIVTGILIFKHIYKILDLSSCIVVDDGLREGVALEGCEHINASL